MNVHEFKPIRFHLLACLMIVITGLIIYSNAIHCSFHFDDYAFMEEPLIKDLHNIRQFFQKNTVSLPSRGLVTTSLAINYYFSGQSVEGYHWVSISVHLLNGILVYFFTLILLNQYIVGKGRAVSGMDSRKVHILALFVALLFTASSIQTHAVVYICKIYDPMASFFYLLSLILFINAVTGPDIRLYTYAASVLSFLCAIWSKEIAYTAPVIMFLYYQCFIAEPQRPAGRGLKLILPYVLLAAVSFYISTPLSEEKLQPDWGHWEYLLTQSNVLIEYIKLLLLPIPSRLNVDFDFNLAKTLWEFPTLISAVSITAVLVAAVLFLHRARLLAFSILWFFVILAPTSSIKPLPEIMVSYRLYLPCLTFYLLFVMGIHRVFCHFGERKGLDAKRLWQTELAIFAGIVIFHGICAYEHNKVWKTEVSLWGDAAKKSPYKVRPHYNLGCFYEREGQIIEAWKQFMICKGIHLKKPNMNHKELTICSKACNNLGIIYKNAGLYDTAIPIFREAIKIDPKNANAHYNLGNIYLHNGNMEAAEVEHKLATLLDPKHPRAYGSLGAVYELKGMQDDAIEAFTNAVRTDPDNADAHLRLGILMLNHKKDPARAVCHLQEARRVCNDPKTLEMVNEVLATLEKQTAVTRPSE